jgi:Tat protein translocase TatB subunit
MLDFGWAELILIMAVAVFFIGPEEIPSVMRTIGRLLRRVQYMKFAVSRQFDELIGDDMTNAVNFEVGEYVIPPKAQQPDGHERRGSCGD